MYLSPNSGTVTPISTATNSAGPPIPVGAFPDAMAITPDGKTVYVANANSNTVTPINTATSKPGPAIKAGSAPAAIAITPDGRTAYVVDGGSGRVRPITIATNKPGTPITVGPLTSDPTAIAITPDGSTAYVASFVAGLVILFAILCVIFWTVPNRRVPWRALWPGALAATVAIGVVDLTFPLYLSHISTIARLGTSLVFIVIVLIWFYAIAIILLGGAIINATRFELHDTGELSIHKR